MEQFTPDTGRSLEEVQQRFERWREGRKRGAPIPAALWEDAVCLCGDHSLCKISRALHLNYNVLKKRYQSACPDHFPESQSVTPSDFIALDLRHGLAASTPRKRTRKRLGSLGLPSWLLPY